MTTAEYSKTRVNARIDQLAEEQLRYVTEHTQMNVTEALKAAIALMYDKVRGEHASPVEILRHAPSFVAMGNSGDATGSEHYKDELARAWNSKLNTDADR